MKAVKNKLETLIQEADLWKATHELFMLKMDGTNELVKILNNQVGDLKSATELVQRWQRDLMSQYVTELINE